MREEAERLDLSYSECIANVLAEKFGVPLVTTPPEDTQMQLTA